MLGASEVPKNQSHDGDNNQVPCPGECVHAFTSILCSKVIEQFNCGAGYLRCCVSSDFTFGTVVETSAPLPEESSTEAAEYDLYLFSSLSNGGGTTKQKFPTSTPPQPHPVAQASATQTTIISTTGKPRPCPGICVENIFVRYCSSTIADGICEKGSTCCVSNSDDVEQPPPPIATTTTATTTTTPATGTTEKNAVIKQQSAPISQASGTPATPSPTLPGPPCPGSCVAPLFSLLCDAVDDNYYCVNDGRCCVSNEEIIAQPITTTTSAPQSKNPCPGACIPIFLQGMCNRPSEIIPLTDCDEDFVCCYQPEIKDHLHVEAPQIPLLRPGAPQQGYPSISVPQNNMPPIRQPSIPHPYPQRPQVPVPPVIVPHINNQGSANQVYLGNNRPGYPIVTQIHPPQPPPHDASIVKIPYQPNNNYGMNPYQQQSFIPVPPKQNSSLDIQPVRLTVLAPANPPGNVYPEEFFPNRRPNMTQIVSQPSQTVQASLYPPKDAENEPLRLVAPPKVQGDVSPFQPNDFRKQQNVRDRFVETSIGFAPDSLRPININVPKKPPSLEKFYPPSPRPSFRPIQKNASTILVLHVDEPEDHIEMIQDMDIKPDATETTFLPNHDSFKPLLTHKPFKPTLNPSSVSPIPTAPAPVTNPKPSIPTQETKPIMALDEMIPNPSNANFYTVSAEQAKKIRPACPGSCIASFLRFTCFGNNAIYDGFACEGSGIMCCTSAEYIEKYEEHLKSGSPLTFIKPDFDAKGSQGKIKTCNY